ncbi:MAG TPA: hypothetical protein VGQ51_11515 [Puia sp.]|nr:hypothetical protein [Puia sp.]
MQAETMKSRYYLTSILEAAIFLLSLVTDWYSPLVITLMVIVLLSMLNRLGKGIVLREIIALHICFVCLVAPLLGYDIFNQNNRLARMFIKYMLVPQPEYYGFALPAVSGFITAICWPIGTRKYDDKGKFIHQLIDRAKAILEQQKKAPLYLLIIGTITFFFSAYLPVAVRFAFELLFFASFAGFLYVYYQQRSRYRSVVLTVFTIVIVAAAVTSGIFTIVAYMSLTLFSFFFLGRRASLFKKILVLLFGVLVLLIIQSVKPTYRIMTWGKSYAGNKAALFGDLVVEKLSNPNLISAEAFFPIYERINQGYNVTLVMRRFPQVVPFDMGSNLLRNLASALVPRFLWPDKPNAGGKYNMAYYAGFYINGWSTNVGPLGEAYGSFGVTGGIIYMILLGAFIRWAYKLVFKLANKMPLLIFWIPVLFYEATYAAETDTLQIMNSLIKAAFFVWLLYKLFPTLFGEERKNTRRRVRTALPYTTGPARFEP